MVWAVFVMVLMIVLLDQLLWRPVVVWSQKFRVEEGAEEQSASSWFYNWIRRSMLIDWIDGYLQRTRARRWVRRAASHVPKEEAPASASSTLLSVGLFAVLVVFLLFGGWRLFELLRQLPLRDYPPILRACGWTLGRVLLSTAIGTLWTLPAGLAIGLSPKLSRIFQPIVQVAASFPAPMLFPLVITVLSAAGVSLGWGSVVLMLLGTQWYILFNVIAGASTIPSELRDVSANLQVHGWLWWRRVALPAIFPYYLTGAITAAGGSWNASIVAELASWGDTQLAAYGLGSYIARATAKADFPRIVLGIAVMSALVVLLNRLFWRPLYRYAEQRFRAG
jgi:NitT/TauT family transport system permease protein